MTTTYSAMMNICGLSQREAAAFHNVRFDTIKSWCAGRNRAPDGAIAELRSLYTKIEAAADQLIDLAESMAEQLGERGEIELGYAADDAEARSLGWPCVGAQLAAIGIAAASIEHRIVLVPRRSTIATAAASNAHGMRE
jgi:hypothetical protein